MRTMETEIVVVAAGPAGLAAAVQAAEAAPPIWEWAP